MGDGVAQPLIDEDANAKRTPSRDIGGSDGESDPVCLGWDGNRRWRVNQDIIGVSICQVNHPRLGCNGVTAGLVTYGEV